MVVPTYNERDRLGALLEQVLAACDREQLTVRVVVVDDNSADGTGAVADEWARRGRVHVIHRSGRLGLGSAVLEGFAIADSEVVGVIDADLSHPPDLIPTLYHTMVADDLDMVVASRYVGDGDARSWSLKRRILSRLGCLLSRPLTPVRDAMSGFFMLRRDPHHPVSRPAPAVSKSVSSFWCAPTCDGLPRSTTCSWIGKLGGAR